MVTHPVTSAPAPLRIGRSPVGSIQGVLLFRRNPLALFTALAEAGDVVPFRLGVPAVFVNAPPLVERVLTERRYTRYPPLARIVRPLVGDSILNSDGPMWQQHRHLMQPAFHRRQIEALTSLMTRATAELVDRWQTQARLAVPVDVAADMKRLTLTMVSRALVGGGLESDAQDFSAAFAVANRFLLSYFALPFPPLWVPTASNRQFKAALRQLDVVVARIIQARRSNEAASDDLLSLLLKQVNEEGQRLSDAQLRDEILTLLLAGHETTANALCWAFALLAAHADVEAKLHTELDEVLGGRAPTMSDLPRLPYTNWIGQEALRLYPGACFQVRYAEQADTLAGLPIPKGTLIVLCAYTAHRRPADWDRPEAFEPERFSPERSAGRPRYAHFPFGGGGHLCIGYHFATQEMQIVLAMLAQRYHLTLPLGRLPEPEGLLSIQPQGGLLMKVLPRARALV